MIVSDYESCVEHYVESTHDFTKCSELTDYRKEICLAFSESNYDICKILGKAQDYCVISVIHFTGKKSYYDYYKDYFKSQNIPFDEKGIIRLDLMTSS
ncbi:MAG: hypothetical protein V1859_05405 [archaeon]